jgi:hypothetical protein
MGVEEKVDALAATTHEFQGEVRNFMKNMTSYVDAVSRNQKAHEKDPDAHPGAARKSWDSNATWLVAAAAVGEAIFHLWKK